MGFRKKPKPTPTGFVFKALYQRFLQEDGSQIPSSTKHTIPFKHKLKSIPSFWST